MKSGHLSGFVLSLVLGAGLAAASDQPADSSPITSHTRMDVIRTFTSDLVYIRVPFPMGTRGLTVRDGNISPTGSELDQLMAMWGPSVKPGDRALITAVMFRKDRIHFEINGGPIHKKKWYQHIEVGAGGNDTHPISPSDSQANPRGSYVDLVFDHGIPDMNPDQLKHLLNPVFNFEATDAEQAYIDTLPPKVKEAVKNHQVLVGMNRDMVIHAKGRPPKKVREKEDEVEYEEWIYGEPPQDVDFVRIVGDDVVRVEIMRVTGERIVKTEKEVDTESKVAKTQTQEPEERPANAPSLRRPGEQAPATDSQTGVNPAPPMAPPDPPQGSPGPQ